MVTFPALIKSGLQARLCVSLLQPTESVQLTIDLVHNDQNQTLLQMSTVHELHHCLDFQAPTFDSVQEIKVVARGKNTLLTETRKVKFLTVKPLTIIRTDKQIYNPGQTVHFRVFTMDTEFKPVDTQYNTVAIQDNKGNRINQWINARATHGKILQLSHVLNPEASVGLYEVSVETNKTTFKEQFQVKKYVLPKFEVKIKQPETVRANEEDVALGVCGRYTHGRPVLGKVKMSLCATMPFYVNADRFSHCVNRSAVLNETGCVSQMFNIFDMVKRTNLYMFPNILKFTASVTEEGTGMSERGSESVPISYSIGSITFLDEPEYFKNGRYIKGKVKVELFNGTPVSKSKVNFLVNSLILTPAYPVITDINGMADFTIDIPPVVKTSFTILASTTSENQFGPPFYFENVLKTLQLQEQPKAKKSQLTIKTLPEPLKCGVVTPVTVQYTVDGSVTIVYLILSRGEIIQQGYKRVTVTNSVLEGEVSFRVHIHPKMAPKMEFLAYCVLPSEIVLAASKTFQTEKCLINKVSAQFSPATAIPGEENTLQLSAQPGSLCGLTGVDQSVLIMEKNKRLNVDNVFSMLPDIFLPYDIEDPVECLNIRARRSRYSPILPYPSVPENTADSVYELFRNMGLKVATNLIVRIPPCVKLRDILYQRVYSGYPSAFVPEWPVAFENFGQAVGIPESGRPAFGIAGAFAGVPGMVGQGLGGVGVGVGIGVPYAVPPIETIRTFFPETWIWDLVEVGDSGSTQVPVKVPDTITTWETEVFCLSSEGLGLAPPAQLTVFQPFFLELSLPYSIIRGEIFELKATVFNYLSKCIMVTITPAPSSDFTLKASSDDQYSSCLCANGRKTFKWILTPSVLGVLNITVSAEAEQSQTVCDNEIVSVPERGRIDTVTQSLHVNAEGVEKTQSHSWFLCPKGQKLIEEIELAFPKNVIEGSARSAVSVL
ncbi:alpha-2-macroglobulin-like, partial [Triplophysa rosa]|uniref:alpha-2-macroglobulin-like n=1 Tax=Triplophysa rosa TaxID=992332 RepID=UPI0025460334